MTSVVFLPEASSELQDAALWYEGQRAGLGLQLLDAVDALVEQIVRWPAAAPLVPGLPDGLPVRRAPISGFPYHVAYLAVADRIHVLAVAHDRRRPGYWHHRANPPG